MRDRHAHYIKPLKRGGVPDHHVVIDTEAKIVKRAGRFEHRFAVGCAVLLSRRGGGGFEPTLTVGHDTALMLWGQVLQLAESTNRLVVWAHNMPYDLRVSQAMRHLLTRGWECEAISLSSLSSWCSWKRGRRKIVVCDSYAWLHVPLDRLAREQGRARPSLPVDPDDRVGLGRRCRADAELLADSVCELLSFIEAEDLGPLRPTGSGQSHAAWRKRFLGDGRVLVHTDYEALDLERQAMHSGRCEAWRWGAQQGPLYEHDLSLAYCRIAAHNRLPTKLLGRVGRGHGDEMRAGTLRDCLMAEVVVTTDTPLVPVQVAGRTLWPTGTFRTVLWDPELALLHRSGAEVQYLRCWLYEASDALASMSQWLIERLDDERHPPGVVERRLLKHWARTLVGRCALRYSQWEYFGRSPWDCLELSYEIARDGGDATAHLQVGHMNFERSAEREANSSCPAIAGWVQSRCRVLLWEAVEAAGPGNVVYMDTDGLLVNRRGDRVLGERYQGGPEARLVRKGRHSNVTIHGPRQVEFDAERRISGLPKGAIRVSEVTWEGELWEGLEQALAAGHHDHVGVMPATWRITPVDHRREHLPGGATRPYRLEDDDEQ